MQKYIQDTIRNNLRPVISDLTVPQQKAVAEMMRGLFTAQAPILAQLAQYEDISVKKQAEKYSHHLGNVDLTVKVESLAWRKAKQQLRKDTIIAYDLTDINKEYAEKMEKLRDVWDGSRRKVAPGFQLHGVGMNNILLNIQVHDDDQYTLPQVRKEIIGEMAPKLDGKGIWVFDRGNDSKGFFRELRQVHDVRYIARVKEDRYVVLKETGEYVPVKDVPIGVHQIYLLSGHNTKIDWEIGELTLIIERHLEEKEPIRLLTNLVWADYGTKRIVTMYLERWGVENIFRRAKTKFDLEKIRVLSYKKFVNLVALIQLAIIVSSTAFLAIQRSTNTLILGVLALYQSFLSWRNLTFNIDSFITFMQNSLKPLQKRDEKPPSLQLNLLSWRQEKRLA
jgi:IS4 transposase